MSAPTATFQARTKPRAPRKPTKTAPIATQAPGIRTPKSAAHDAIPAYARLSFVKGSPTRYGWSVDNWFSVPDDADECGCDGLLAFQELQQFVKANGGIGKAMNQLIVQWALLDAFNAKCESDSHAAQAFISCVAHFATAMMARDTGACVAGKIEQAQKLREQVRVFKAQRRAAFVARMQAARAAKRAAREAASIAARPGTAAQGLGARKPPPSTIPTTGNCSPQAGRPWAGRD